MEIKELIQMAKEAKTNSYSPYSSFEVGSVLVTKSGNIYKGCNVENAGIMSICGERTAFLSAIAKGERDFECILTVAGPKNGGFVKSTPCGYCRQFMKEFCDNDFVIYVCYGEDEKVEKFTLGELLPNSFEL